MRCVSPRYDSLPILKICEVKQTLCGRHPLSFSQNSWLTVGCVFSFLKITFEASSKHPYANKKKTPKKLKYKWKWSNNFKSVMLRFRWGQLVSLVDALNGLILMSCGHRWFSASAGKMIATFLPTFLLHHGLNQAASWCCAKVKRFPFLVLVVAPITGFGVRVVCCTF